jgi:hypothetical protein
MAHGLIRDLRSAICDPLIAAGTRISVPCLLAFRIGGPGLVLVEDDSEWISTRVPRLPARGRRAGGRPGMGRGCWQLRCHAIDAVGAAGVLPPLRRYWSAKARTFVT